MLYGLLQACELVWLRAEWRLELAACKALADSSQALEIRQAL